MAHGPRLAAAVAIQGRFRSLRADEQLIAPYPDTEKSFVLPGMRIETGSDLTLFGGVYQPRGVWFDIGSNTIMNGPQ